jgi:hypothetical protein
VRFGAAAACRCGVGGQVAAVVGAEVVVAIGEPPGVCYPAGLLVWRLFILAGMDPESRL